MNEQATWQEGNARFLSTALEWLRLRLEQYGQQWEKPTGLPALPEPQHKPCFLRRTPTEPPRSIPVALSKVPATSSITHEQVAQKASDMTDAESQMEPPPALVVLSRRLGLSRFERDVLLLCVALELDTRIAALCARAQDDPNKPYPTFALALALFDEASWDILSPERPLRHLRLIEINQPGAQPLTTSPLRADERIVNYVKGLNYLDDRLASLIAPFEIDEDKIQLPPSQQSIVEAIVRYWQQVAITSSSLPIIQLAGPDVPSKQLVAYHAAAQVGRHLCRIPLEMLPSQPADLEILARLWQRESLLLPIALYLDAQEIDSAAPAEGQAQPLNRFLDRAERIFFLGIRETWPHLGRANITVDVTRPTPAEQQTAWKEVLGEAAPASPALLAGQFNLNLTTIHHIAQAELDKTAGDKTSLPDRLWDACRVRVRPRLDTLAQRLDSKVTWNDLVLPGEEMNMLHQIADQVMQRSKVYETWGFAQKMSRGFGINALFAGESGTGKTMAAEVIANALRLNLYRIDLSAVVSKYIGETEKNLRRLFDAAEDGGVILFFDEADALFGKRSEVKDSHDRYANIEINYLLQRMEAYRGLAILATNMKSALDTAFMRRLRFMVNFPFPGPTERKHIWEKAFPPKTPIKGLDYDRLARFNLTGGSIHNVALNAAFLAAQSGPPVTMAHVLQAVRAEYHKLERPINESEFRWQPAPAAQGAKV